MTLRGGGAVQWLGQKGLLSGIGVDWRLDVRVGYRDPKYMRARENVGKFFAFEYGAGRMGRMHDQRKRIAL